MTVGKDQEDSPDCAARQP